MPVITGTGFHGEGRTQVRQAAENCGAEYSGDLKQGVTTHLVCSDSTGAAVSAKLQRAADWGIPALQWAWLTASAARGRLLPKGLYLYSGPGSEVAAVELPSSAAGQSGSATGHSSGAAEPHAAAEPSSSANAPAAEPQRRGDAHALSPRSETAAMLQQRQLSGAGHAGSISSGAKGSGSGAKQQENLDPHAAANLLPDGRSPATERCSAQPSKEAGALAARLGSLQLGSGQHGSSLPDGAAGQLSEDDAVAEMPNAAEPPPAAASLAGSCTCSDDDGVTCAQPSPGPVALSTLQPLPSPTPTRRKSPGCTGAADLPASPGDSAAVPSSMAAASSSPDLWDSPAASSVRRAPPLPPSSSVHMPGSTPLRPAPAVSSGAVLALKLLARPPRGNTAVAFHGFGRKEAAKLQFAEQVQVLRAALVLSSKDKKAAAVLQPPPPVHEDSDDPDAAVTRGAGAATQPPPPLLAEIKSLYCLPSGEWWLEYCRFFKGADIELLAVDCGQAIPLPVEFDRHCELLKGIERFHCPVLDVTGQKRVRHSKHTGPAHRVRNDGGGFFWRYCFDTELRRCVTDKPVTQFVVA